MNTKQKILISARNLFNKDGISETSMRDISMNIGISPGNLTYHFRYKENIVEAIYYELISQLDSELAKIDENANELSLFYASTKSMIYVVYDYRCIFRDLYKILSINQKLKTNYIELKKYRLNQFWKVLDQMIGLKIIRPEKTKGEYTRLSSRIYLLSNNWINALELQKFKYPKDIDYYSFLIFDSLYPYLTNKGKEQYLTIMNEQK